MGKNLVIAAVPDENDRVWKVSSEKVPHLTLLFLGDSDKVANLQQIIQFVEHAANTSMERFHMVVDRRGELGDDKADVLFFKKGFYAKSIRDFRAMLLQDPNIKTAFDSVEQYPTWTPHLTLGYPETPANKEPDDHGFWDVGFTKIAVWTGDYEGPEFVLKDYWDEFDVNGATPMDVAMSATDETVLEFLEHFGVKGMRWGQRKSEARASKASGLRREAAALNARGLNKSADKKDKKAAKLEAKVQRRTPEAKAERKAARRDKWRRTANAVGDHFWQTNIYSSAAQARVHNQVGKEIDSKIYKLQTSPKYAGKNLRADKKLKDEYDQDVVKVTDAAYRRAVKDTFGDNVSGTKEARYVDDVRGARIEIRDKRTGDRDGEVNLRSIQEITADRLEQSALAHAKVAAPDITIPLELDDKGHVIGIGLVETEETLEQSVGEMLHSAELGAAFVLEHYGVKGMRWGQRKSKPPPVPVAPTAKVIVPRGAKSHTKVKVEGGENHTASPDAIKVAEAKAKLRKSGTAALSNAELREVANRAQLEAQVRQVTQSGSRKWVGNFLRRQGDQTVGAVANQNINRQLKTRGVI